VATTTPILFAQTLLSTQVRSPTCLPPQVVLTVSVHLAQLLQPLLQPLPLLQVPVAASPKPVAKALSSPTPVPASSPSALLLSVAAASSSKVRSKPERVRMT
jgi:hypothetical protein